MTTTRKVVLTIELTVRDMTDEEWTEANEGVELDEDDQGPSGWVKDLEAGELNEAIEGALDSASNPEMFAGSGLFVVTENARVLSAKWQP